MTARLLIGNDDGIFALGVRALANAMAEAGHEVTVVCPDRERSATGHSLTMHEPIRATRIEGIFHPAVTAWSCSGTPSDCIKLALGALLDRFPDFVLSGINQGSNTGTDILYSGTVSAAMEGTIEGLPSIAFSLAHYTSPEFGVAANFAVRLMDKLVGQTLPESFLLNVNVPNVPFDALKGYRVCRLGERHKAESVIREKDPRGHTVFWIGPAGPEADCGPGTDFHAVESGYVALTPLTVDLTRREQLDTVATWLETGHE